MAPRTGGIPCRNRRQDPDRGRLRCRHRGAGRARVGQLLRKEHLTTDPEAQLLEDAACLVFLENFFTDFSRQHDDAKVIDILRKTWVKMSPKGHAAALTLKESLPADRWRLVEEALSGAAA
jgi:hypothetical protein